MIATPWPGNITGVTQLNVEVGPKRVELAHELIPAATVIALLVNPTNPLAEAIAKDSQAAARILGLQLHVLHASTEHDFDAVFKALVQLRAAAASGAGPLRAFFRVCLPQIAPGVAAGAVFAFATSLDEVVIALFIAGPAQRTLPRQMFAGLNESISLTTAAASAMLVGLSVVLLLVVAWLQGRAPVDR